MVIASIDMKGGHVVQLKNGKDLVLQRDDADSLISEFDKYGEVAAIDLDQALRNTDAKGNTANTPLLKSLLRKGNVRVGGGIRDVKKARELISLGAEKVIVGSAAWNENPGENGLLNTAFLDELVAAIGKQRIIISVDAIHGKIAVKGWTETVDIPLVEGAKAAEKYCSELLFTCVEKEGCMQGTDMESCRALRDAVKCRVVVAGGVNSLEQIVELEKMGCDVQLGMALYTGAVSLRDSFIGCLDWEKVGGMVPVIAQSTAGEVLMMGYANREAMEKSFDTGKLTFFSRTRNKLWTKGETSGNFLEIVRLRADCDRDTVLATVIPNGADVPHRKLDVLLRRPRRKIVDGAPVRRHIRAVRQPAPGQLHRHARRQASPREGDGGGGGAYRRRRIEGGSCLGGCRPSLFCQRSHVQGRRQLEGRLRRA